MTHSSLEAAWADGGAALGGGALAGTLTAGRYSLIDVSGVDAAPVKAAELRKCNGCDAALARSAGADQSLVGIVTRITRTDYAVTFRLRDAKSGAVIDVEQTDLRIGASYSWNRGAAWLIQRKLLDKPQHS